MSDSNKTVFDMVSDIWGIADYLRDVIKRSEYNRIVLPFSLLRRLECALEPTRDAVLEAYQEHQIDWVQKAIIIVHIQRKLSITSLHLD